MGKVPEQILLHGQHIEGQETHKKKKKSASREMQIKTTMGYHFTLVRVAIINQQTTSTGEVVEKGNPNTLLVGMQAGAATGKMYGISSGN